MGARLPAASLLLMLAICSMLYRYFKRAGWL